MKYVIIEDCSPFYIRYVHEGSDDIIDICKTEKSNTFDQFVMKKKFKKFDMSLEVGSIILQKVYKSSELRLNPTRVSLFITQPGYYYRPHRDGLAVPMGINYNVDIRDDECVTSWYDNQDFAGRPIDNLPSNTSREIADYNREIDKHIIKPKKSMTARQSEVLLFNTDLFHDVDNTTSKNERTILTLRSLFYQRLNFFDARKILFGY